MNPRARRLRRLRRKERMKEWDEPLCSVCYRSLSECKRILKAAARRMGRPVPYVSPSRFRTAAHAELFFESVRRDPRCPIN